MSSSHLTRVAFALALTLAAPAVLAYGDSRAGARITHIDAIDLNPADDIPPLYYGWPVSASLHVGVLSNAASISLDSSPDPSVASELRTPFPYQAGAFISSASVDTLAIGESSLHIGGYMEAESHLHRVLVLGAYTGMTFRGSMYTEASSFPQYGDDYLVVSAARAAFVGSAGNVHDEYHQESRHDPGGQGNGHTSDFALYVGNPTDHRITVDVYFDARSYAMQTAIPEPSIAAMLGTGLLLPVAALRRRGRHGGAGREAGAA
jgi:hypothetical protein